jgi:hypothetical protein
MPYPKYAEIKLGWLQSLEVDDRDDSEHVFQYTTWLTYTGSNNGANTDKHTAMAELNETDFHIQRSLASTWQANYPALSLLYTV